MSGDAPGGDERHGPLFHARNLDGERAPRRSYSEIPEAKRGALRDTDLQDVNVKANALLGAIPGLVLGAALGYFLDVQYGAPGWVVLLTIAAGGASVPLGTIFLVSRASRGASLLYNPSGSSTPHKKEYSYPESLAVRGQHEDAIAAFEVAIADDPGAAADPTPYLRIARIYRDDLQRYEDAARWFRRALQEPPMPPGLRMLATKELVELYETRVGTPAKAAPLLARLAHELEGTPDGAWAADTLARIKQEMAEGGEPA